MNKNQKNGGRLFFLADAWMTPLSLFAAIYLFIKGNTLLGALMVLLFIGSVVKLCRWARDRKNG